MLPWSTDNESDQDPWYSEMESGGLFGEPITLGSWCNIDEAQYFFARLIDRNVQFQKREKIRQSPAKDIRMRAYATFDTSVRRGVPAWDVKQDVELVKEYRTRKGLENAQLPENFEQRWHQLRCKYWRNITDLVHGRVEMLSISEEQCRERANLDDPSTGLYRTKRRYRTCPEFIEMKAQNTIEWQNFLDT